MKTKRRAVIGMLVMVSLLAAARSRADSLYVYSIENVNGNYYYNDTEPYLAWSSAKVQSSYNAGQSGNANGTWVPADNFLIIQTSQQYNQGSWAVEVYTDNTWLANNQQGATYNLPDYWVGAGCATNSQPCTFVPGGSQTAPLTSYYSGYHTIQQCDHTNANCQNPSTCHGISGCLVNVLPKGGIVSLDGLQTEPMIWSFYNGLPNNWQTMSIVENANKTNCDFQSCSWFSFLDKGDRKLNADGSTSSYWLDHYWYEEPLSQTGGQYAVDSWWQPYYYSNGWTDQYLLVGANFRNGTRQVFYTTVFVELQTF